MIKKFSKIGREKRLEERKDFKNFYERHIENAKNLKCEECGCQLKGTVSEIAHILPKNYFKSISTLDENVIYLCGMYSKNNCHAKYDNCANEEVRKMNIFKKVSDSFLKMESKITEKINYKHTDRWQA